MSIHVQKGPIAAVFELSEPMIPLPAPSVRNWLLVALVAWNVVLFWMAPISVIVARNWAAISSTQPPDSFTSTWLPAQVFAEVCVGMNLALAGNLALLLAKARVGVLTRLFGAMMIFCLAQMGMAATFGRGYFAGFAVLCCLLSFVALCAATLGWLLLPGLWRQRLIELDDFSPSEARPSGQLRIIHLFYLMSAVAMACCALPMMLTSYVRVDDLFHEPVDKVFMALLLSGVTCLFTWTVHKLSLSPGHQVWSLTMGTFVVPTIAFFVSYLTEGITGREWSMELFVTSLVVLSITFSLLGGTGLALRLLGYRLA